MDDDVNGLNPWVLLAVMAMLVGGLCFCVWVIFG